MLHSFSSFRKLYSCNSPVQVLGNAKKESWLVFAERRTLVRHILWTLDECQAPAINFAILFVFDLRHCSQLNLPASVNPTRSYFGMLAFLILDLAVPILHSAPASRISSTNGVATQFHAPSPRSSFKHAVVYSGTGPAPTAAIHPWVRVRVDLPELELCLQRSSCSTEPLNPFVNSYV